jgi:CHAD domain-containing protein
VSTTPSASQPWPVQRASELLDRLEHEVRRAAKHPDADAVHDVRVAIRRLRQCLEVFAPLFPSRVSKKLRERVRRVLKTAGELRNLDIAIELLKKSRLAGTGPLIREIRKERVKTAKEFVEAIAKLRDGDIAGKWRSKLAAPSNKRVLIEDYVGTLPVIAAGFFEAGERAADASADSDTLHKFRIKTKKFRYTLELFEPVYGATLNARMRVLRNVQQRLGDINDYAASARILKNYRDGHGAVVDRGLEHLARLAAAEVKDFRRYFHRALGPKQKGLWIQYLSGGKAL